MYTNVSAERRKKYGNTKEDSSSGKNIASEGNTITTMKLSASASYIITNRISNTVRTHWKKTQHYYFTFNSF